MRAIGASAIAVAEGCERFNGALEVKAMLKLVRRHRLNSAPIKPPVTVDPFDRRGYRRSPVAMPGYRLGKEPPNKGLTLKPEPLTPDEVFRLMVACGTASAGNRNRAMIAVGARAGLRCAEMLALYPKDVDLERGRIHVMHGKFDKDRYVDFDPGACAIVKTWMVERRGLGFDGRRPVFLVINGPTAGLPVNAAYVRWLMKTLGERAGIEKRCHYHGLRHTYASYLLDKGVPMHIIKTMLGHSSVVITEHYADHIGNAAAMDAVRRLVEWPDHAAALQSSQSWLTA
jgi:integrase